MKEREIKRMCAGGSGYPIEVSCHSLSLRTSCRSLLNLYIPFVFISSHWNLTHWHFCLNQKSGKHFLIRILVIMYLFNCLGLMPSYQIYCIEPWCTHGAGRFESSLHYVLIPFLISFSKFLPQMNLWDPFQTVRLLLCVHMAGREVWYCVYVWTSGTGLSVRTWSLKALLVYSDWCLLLRRHGWLAAAKQLCKSYPIHWRQCLNVFSVEHFTPCLHCRPSRY